MVAIENFPSEVIAAILRSLDNIRFLPPAILTCRHFYISFKEQPSIQFEILRRQVTPDLLPYLIALEEASRLPRPHTRASIKALLDTLYDEPAQLVVRLQTQPLSNLLTWGRTHDMIESGVNDFATHAWAHLALPNSDFSHDNILSTKEHFRFCRAFYRYHLFFCLFAQIHLRTLDIWGHLRMELFFLRHPWWENEQIACVLDFLKMRLFEACSDRFAHDIEFGNYGVDYINRRFDSGFQALRALQGIHFLDRLKQDSSYETQKALFNSVLTYRSLRLFDEFRELCRIAEKSTKYLGIYTEEEIQTWIPRIDNQDTDRGPCKAWYSASLERCPNQWIMSPTNTTLREYAYVLWDLTRIERHNMISCYKYI